MITGTPMEQPGVLNVVFHGLFLYFQKKDGTVLAIIPDIGDEKRNHVFLAGNWFAEEPIDASKKPLTLDGVEGGKATFNHAKNLDLRGFPLKKNYLDLSYRVIELPQPSSIVSTRLSPIPGNSLRGKAVDYVKPQYLANTQVFTYRHADRNAVRLGDHKWRPAGKALSMNLHIRHEPAQEMTEAETRQHALVEFNAHLGLLEGLELEMVEPILTSSEPPEVTELDLPRGVAYVEMTHFTKRHALLEEFWSELRRGGDLNQYWRKRRGGSQTAEADPSACSGGEGGDEKG